MITTTLNKIKFYRPCKKGWEQLLKHLGKTKPDDELLKFSTILESNGIDDAVWCLRSVCPEHEREVRLFAADCAARVLPIYESKYLGDKRPRMAIEAAKKFANGEITARELDAAMATARDAAMAAAMDAAMATARDAAMAAARDAARAAAWAAWAAWDAAMDAVWSAWDAAMAAAMAASIAAARDAARDAAWAGWDAAMDAVWSARAAARAAAMAASIAAARDAARDAERKVQSQMLVERFS